jgi:hypothetical protein
MVKNLPINVERDIRGDAMIYSFPKPGLKRTHASFLRRMPANNTLPHIRLIFTGGFSLIINRVLRTRTVPSGFSRTCPFIIRLENQPQLLILLLTTIESNESSFFKPLCLGLFLLFNVAFKGWTIYCIDVDH